MRNNETGEYELQVGNGQLLSAFFIIILLLSVAFVMGYVVGQNSPRSAKTQAEESATAPSAVASAPDAASPVPATQAPPQDAAANATPASSDAATTPAAADAPPQPTTQPAREAPSATAPPEAAQPDAPPGSFWQVGAWSRAADAQPIFQTLKDGGMPVSIKTGADGLVRVMVGPYSDTQALNRARTELETRFGIHPIRK